MDQQYIQNDDIATYKNKKKKKQSKEAKRNKVILNVKKSLPL